MVLQSTGVDIPVWGVRLLRVTCVLDILVPKTSKWQDQQHLVDPSITLFWLQSFTCLVSSKSVDANRFSVHVLFFGRGRGGSRGGIEAGHGGVSMQGGVIGSRHTTLGYRTVKRQSQALHEGNTAGNIAEAARLSTWQGIHPKIRRDVKWGVEQWASKPDSYVRAGNLHLTST
ncbi:hypothetical protein P154DRAFT_194451 [Amniculicola lignicola CBS 123094]|uniref:Uncharacterized protein n=1 Tax=Amniculicola lignicola CBS 123094 TaxID=1392246 RepID=A0A6A5WFT1_9PLEO|nr:hypothetical protein P154DRAFT_194451 [Amniculicola lignicola CBS 123094]